MKQKINFLILIIITILAGSFLPACCQGTTLCPNINCPSPCSAIDGSTCICLPLGCDKPPPSPSPVPVNIPFCMDNVVICGIGIPRCSSNKKPVCGSLFGFENEFAGPGCTNKKRTFFDLSGIFCDTNLETLETDEAKCKRKKLCKGTRKKSCREDRALCKCVCSFKPKLKYTPGCNKNDIPTCPKDLVPACSNTGNKPVCNKRKLFCETTDGTLVDLTDEVSCK